MQANNGEINYNVETVYVKEEYNIKEEKVRLASLPFDFFFQKYLLVKYLVEFIKSINLSLWIVVEDSFAFVI